MSERYASHYEFAGTIFPSAFAAKVFLGNTHGLRKKIKDFGKASILEIGFGDGRDLMLFQHLQYDISGLEMNEKIVELARKRLNCDIYDSKIDLRVGSNTLLPANQAYDIVYSSAALYYLENQEVDMVEHILKPIRACLNTGGLFIASFAKKDTHYIQDSYLIKKNVYLIKDTIFNLRPDQLIYAVETKDELQTIVENSGLKVLQIGDWSVDWFGIQESMFMLIAEKTN